MYTQDLNQYWKTVVDTIQDGIMIVSPDGIFVSVNRGFEEITGYSASEILGKSCAVLTCSSCEIIRKTDDGHWCGMFRRGELVKHKCRLRRKDGTWVHVVKNAAILRDHWGGVIGAVETLNDISDLIDKEIQIETYRRELDGADRYHGMIGVSAAMQQVFEMVTNAAESDAPVIVFGESGTGKELAARAIHDAGPRRNKPYIKVNCAALNEALLESELFGHVKGAFTGALRSRQGRFEAANHGDIFLDEIGDLPLSTQIKLLRVLEEKIIERVGDHRPIKVDVRIISATNQDLADLIAKGMFREDFYYRINSIPILVPPLRQRAEDIPFLARSFFERINLKSAKHIQGISNEALEALMCYSWPGNVRELRSAIEYAFVSCQGEAITSEDLPGTLLNRTIKKPKRGRTIQSLDEIKKQRLVQALKAAKGNQSEAARLLGISRTSVWKQLKRHRLRAKNFSFL